MSIDLNKLANKLDEALSNETTETLTKFLTNKRMSNNKQSSVEWFAKEINELNFWLESRQITNREFNRLKLKVLNKAKEKHKEEVLSFDTLLHEHEMEALNNNTILLTKEEFYNETFGGNNEQQ